MIKSKTRLEYLNMIFDKIINPRMSTYSDDLIVMKKVMKEICEEESKKPDYIYDIQLTDEEYFSLSDSLGHIPTKEEYIEEIRRLYLLEYTFEDKNDYENWYKYRYPKLFKEYELGGIFTTDEEIEEK